MTFENEGKFEDAIIKLLVEEKGWDGGVINRPSEEDLIQNWADIIFKINNEVDRLNGVPLNKGEINQLMAQVNSLATSNQRNSFINDKTVIITRENEKDKLHYGKEISLKIFDRNEIAAGSSIYQIAQQPRFKKDDPVDYNRRGDFMLLINGLPVIHVELKKDGVPLMNAVYQIKQYLAENKFRGLFSLVQIFVAMTPDDMLYFANPGDKALNKDYFFKWADFNNEPRTNWDNIASEFLSIPMAHQLIGYYTIADSKDEVLKVMRSYQIYATREIVDRVREKQRNNWSIRDQRGGYIWHTTGSGKTMTSFKAAELIAQLKYCDKVIFLVDRITLASQTVSEFEGFSPYEEIYATENTDALLSLLEDDNLGRLIVTSIQKMSNIVDGKVSEKKLADIKNKRIVFIVDEAHRSTFGTMMTDIKNTYEDAMFFGFTGTPIQTQTNNTDSTEITTADIFGNELHHYTLADGIRDENVLAFDITKVQTIKEMDLRRELALYKAHVNSIAELKDKDKAYKIYSEWMDSKKHSILEIESILGNVPYEKEEHRQKVVDDILNSWIELNYNNLSSAIFATSSIKEAISYWRMLKDNELGLKVTCIFDASDDFNEFTEEKTAGLKDIIKHYNKMYNKSFSLSTHASFKADVANRLAQKRQYRNITKEIRDEKTDIKRKIASDEKIDIVIVVYQLLTGFDSKWVSMLFLDKVLEMHNLIQAFSRTNRLNGTIKPHGIIKYYRRPATMEYNIKKAVKEYSGDNPYMMFVDKLPMNVRTINHEYEEIRDVFKMCKIENFSRLPEDDTAIKKFVSHFNILNKALISAIAQSFRWDKSSYYDKDKKEYVTLAITEEEYQTLLARYRELASEEAGHIPIDIEFDYTIIDDSFKIDFDYMNENFNKYLKELQDPNSSKEYLDELKNSLHKNFTLLPRDKQAYAEMIMNDLQSGDLKIVKESDFNDYINAYSVSELDRQIDSMVKFTGINEEKLRSLLMLKPTENNINEFGRFDSLKESADIDQIIDNLTKVKGSKVPVVKAKIYLDRMIRKFLTNDTFYIDQYNDLIKGDL